jgi:hypothetical protein
MAKKSTEATPSKVDMVREAINSLGWDAKIDTLHQYIVEKYGVDMSKGHISQTKSNEKKKQGIKTRRRRSKKGAAAEFAPVGAEPVAAANVSDIIALVSEVTKWQQKVGSSTVREIVKTVLGK